MNWTNGVGKFLKDFGEKIMKEERTIEIEDEITSNPQLLILDLLSGESVILASKDDNNRTKNAGYIRRPDVVQRIPHKIPPTLVQNVLLDMIVPMLAKQIGEEKKLDYEVEENWSPLIKAAYTRITESILEAQENQIKNKKIAKVWKENNAKHKKEIQIVVDKLTESTLTKKNGDMICNYGIEQMEPMHQRVLHENVMDIILPYDN